MTLTSTYDHRVIQGAQSGEYLRRVEELLDGADYFYEGVFSAFGLDVRDAQGRAVAPARAAAPAIEIPREHAGHADELLRAVAAGMALLSSYRRHGHLAATLDPLGTRTGRRSRARRAHLRAHAVADGGGPGFGVAHEGRRQHARRGVAEAAPRRTASTIAYEVEHIANIEQREWLREYIESGRHRIPLSATQRGRACSRG